MTSSRVWLMTSLFIIIWAGCSTPMVRSVRYDADSAKNRCGVLYYLPKKLVKATVDVKDVPLAKVQKEYGETLFEIDAIEKTIETLEKELETLKVEASSDTNGNGKVVAMEARIKAWSRVNSEAKEKAGVLMSLMVQTPTKVVDISFEVLPAIPDKEHGYVLFNEHEKSRSDDFTFSTSPNGLLESGEFTSEDQTVTIVTKLVEAATIIMRIGIAKVAPSHPVITEPGVDLPKHAEIVFDPVVPEDCTNVTDLITKYNSNLVFRVESNHNPKDSGKYDEMKKKVTRWTSFVDYVSFEMFSLTNAIQYSTVSGIMYRREVPYTLVLEEKAKTAAGGKGVRVLDQVIYLPNNGPISRFDLRAGKFVKSEYALKFKEGLLTSVDATCPSEALGLVKTLPDSLKAIASVPAEILQLKIDYSSKESESLKKETEVIKAELEHLEAMQDKKGTP